LRHAVCEATRSMSAIPSARFVVPLLVVFWLAVALVMYAL
jgi:hypothetical protein